MKRRRKWRMISPFFLFLRQTITGQHAFVTVDRQRGIWLACGRNRNEEIKWERNWSRSLKVREMSCYRGSCREPDQDKMKTEIPGILQFGRRFNLGRHPEDDMLSSIGNWGLNGSNNGIIASCHATSRLGLVKMSPFRGIPPSDIILSRQSREQCWW